MLLNKHSKQRRGMARGMQCCKKGVKGANMMKFTKVGVGKTCQDMLALKISKMARRVKLPETCKNKFLECCEDATTVM